MRILGRLDELHAVAIPGLSYSDTTDHPPQVPGRVAAPGRVTARLASPVPNLFPIPLRIATMRMVVVRWWVG